MKQKRRQRDTLNISPDCVVKVGAGRGFIIGHRAKIRPYKIPGLGPSKEFRESRLVVTAAHCLPKLPPSCSASGAEERTYNLLGTLDGSKKSILTECLFVNPVADIAVLGAPDGQTFFEADAYDQLTEDAPFLRIGKARAGKGWVLSPGGRWTRTTIEASDYTTALSIGPDGPNEPGMSGSPVLNDAGLAVGVVVIGSETISKKGIEKMKAGPQPILLLDLPGWLLSR